MYNIDMTPLDTNKIVISGKINDMDSARTISNKSIVNFSVSIDNKYSDILPCQAYGDLADLIMEKYKISTHVIIVGRLRSVGHNEDARQWIVVEKIGEEL